MSFLFVGGARGSTNARFYLQDLRTPCDNVDDHTIQQLEATPNAVLPKLRLRAGIGVSEARFGADGPPSAQRYRLVVLPLMAV